MVELNSTRIELQLIILDFSDWKPTLHLVRIYFDTPTFDRITKDSAVSLEDIIATVGGTLGLFTGFSIISGVEILFFIAKLLFAKANLF